MEIRSSPSQRHKLTPFEIIMGRPMRTMATITPAPDLNLTHSTLLQYCKGLMQAVSSFHSQVRAAWPTEPTSAACHTLEPGDWVYLRHHLRKHALEPRWKGPYQGSSGLSPAPDPAMDSELRAGNFSRVASLLHGQLAGAVEEYLLVECCYPCEHAGGHKKSPGPDEKHPRILKELMEEVSEPLSIIFGKSWETGEIPEDWKRQI
ncbi:uncharacterized protein LOC142015634 [Carettochelys insculpta]|uniref:uncharacterized protein LOC142015634 n=1 Tax=Carettochelys insculpta TaxID=44489 RepID=UPI003EBFC9C4